MQVVSEQARSQTGRRENRKKAIRDRIVRATIELHQTLGPAHTTISDIARRAGVQRLTVYRYFPDERALRRACSTEYRVWNPPPDPEAWLGIADPEARLEQALSEVIPYYRRTAPMLSRVLRDAEVNPLVREAAEGRYQYNARVRQVLEVGWKVRGRRLRLLRAAIAHAVDFRAWESLSASGLDDMEVAEVLTGFVDQVARPCGRNANSRRRGVLQQIL